MSEKKKNYAFSSYDKHLCLVPDFNMWFIFLFLIRPYVVLVVSLSNKSDRMGLINLLYADKLMMSLGALAGIPALLVVYALIKRDPDASEGVKKIWHKGRELLAISAVFNVLLAFSPMMIRGVQTLGVHAWWQLAGSVLVLGLVLKSEYIKDCFLDFPRHSKES